MLIGHCKELLKLTFQAVALYQSEICRRPYLFLLITYYYLSFFFLCFLDLHAVPTQSLQSIFWQAKYYMEFIEGSTFLGANKISSWTQWYTSHWSCQSYQLRLWLCKSKVYDTVSLQNALIAFSDCLV